MTSPLPHACMAGPPSRQRGISLIELLVGLILGLLVVGVAIGALMASRSVTGTVSDASQLQQQASHIFRTMGRQIRQAGSLRLLPASQKADTAPVDIMDTVAFEAKAADFDPAKDSIRGLDEPASGQYKLSVGYGNYAQPLHSAQDGASLQRNCLGQANSATLIQSHFVLDADSHTLRCAGQAGGSGRQPFAENVANFQVRYLRQAPGGAARIQYVNAAAVGSDWHRVQGVEICLVLFGNEPIDLPAGSTYTDCAGSDGKKPATIDMATLPAPRTRRMHLVFRSVYQLRSQGLPG